MARTPIKNHISWYESQFDTYKSLAEMISATLKALLKHNKIDHVDVPCRAKSIESFQEKIRRKRYKDPKSEMTDLAGIRVIAYIEADVQKIAQIIQTSFNVHIDASGDKSNDLGEDRFGYRSVHFVCDIGKDREDLPEFSPYKDFIFEIQVRTALQHTWAEIEHDRSYKFSGDLPPKIKRRFHLVAGLLELADREFDELTTEIDAYKAEVHRKADSGILDIELNSTSILEYLTVKLAKTHSKITLELSPVPQEVIEELHLFGANSLKDLDPLLTKEFMAAEQKNQSFNNSVGFLRNAMLYSDMNKYFEKCWRSSWSGFDTRSINMLREKHGDDMVYRAIAKYELDAYDEDEINDQESL